MFTHCCYDARNMSQVIQISSEPRFVHTTSLSTCLHSNLLTISVKENLQIYCILTYIDLNILNESEHAQAVAR